MLDYVWTGHCWDSKTTVLGQIRSVLARSDECSLRSALALSDRLLIWVACLLRSTGNEEQIEAQRQRAAKLKEKQKLLGMVFSGHMPLGLAKEMCPQLLDEDGDSDEDDNH